MCVSVYEDCPLISRVKWEKIEVEEKTTMWPYMKSRKEKTGVKVSRITSYRVRDYRRTENAAVWQRMKGRRRRKKN